MIVTADVDAYSRFKVKTRSVFARLTSQLVPAGRDYMTKYSVAKVMISCLNTSFPCGLTKVKGAMEVHKVQRH